MSNLTEALHKESSTKALLEKSRDRFDDIKQVPSQPDANLNIGPTGVGNDKSKAPIQDLDKGGLYRKEAQTGGPPDRLGRRADYPGVN